MQHYVAPLWLAGKGALAGNVQTIWPALASLAHPDRRDQAVQYQRRRWRTPDEDFIDVDHLPAAEARAGRPLLVLFHGLEGSSQSHYSRAFAWWAHARGWDYVVPHFRGCSGELNLAPRAYHSGDFEEIGWVLARMRTQHQGPIVAVGVSLGGNALLRWAAEVGADAARSADAVAAVCSPIDLAAGGHAIGRGFNRQVYTRMFMRTLVPKALLKWAQFPGLFDRDAVLRARDLREFDDAFTAPVHGFRDAQDYWHRAAAKPLLGSIAVPALLLNALDDPFVPSYSLPAPGEVGPRVTLWHPPHGGHVGFAQGRWPGHVLAMPQAVTQWLAHSEKG